MLNSTIAVISYNTPHRKTQDVLFHLKAKNYTHVHVFALPFIHRENPFVPIFQHRPSRAIDLSPEVFCSHLGYQFSTTTSDILNDQLHNLKADFILIAGAGLLPNQLVEQHKIINAHPGYLPFTRGLDSLKWAIMKNERIGVTTHFIDTEADAGFLIDQKYVPVYSNDTFHAVAYRQYEMEIEMLVEAIELIPNKTDFPSLSTKQYEATRRMPKAIEENLIKGFEMYKAKFLK